MMSFFKKISPYTTGLFFPLFAQFVFAGARKGVLVFIAVGSLLLQLLVNAAVETSGRRKGIPAVKRHLVKLSFAILFNSVLLSVHGFFDLSDTTARRRFFIFVVVGISLLIKDFLILKKPVFEKQSEEGKSGLAQYVKFVMYLVLGLVLVVLINIAVIRFGPPKAPYFWANQIKESSELEDFDDGVILFGRETCPSCIEVERILRGLPKNKRQVLYYFDTDSFRQDDTFQEILQKYQVESVPTLVVIVDGSWVGTYSLVGDDKTINEKAINEAYYRYYLGIAGS